MTTYAASKKIANLFSWRPLATIRVAPSYGETISEGSQPRDGNGSATTASMRAEGPPKPRNTSHCRIKLDHG